ncbi:MAG: type II toxin-antitoxin system PemK/MazF family toxin [Bacillota bacterium]|nr:type II toxin-antitoxin system PemK/MazF family toxin [Bacillota bacterium]
MSKYKELDDLETLIEGMDSDLQTKYLKWLKLSNWYLKNEKTFKPEKYAKYNPGDVITINFGFNVGAEFGGRHFAVVVEDNTRKAGTVMVTPLSSCSSEEEVKDPSVYLGVIKELNFPGTDETHSFAVINQTRPISKLRISTPAKPTEPKLNIGSDLLEKIYANTEAKYTGTYPENKEPKIIDPTKP